LYYAKLGHDGKVPNMQNASLSRGAASQSAGNGASQSRSQKSTSASSVNTSPSRIRSESVKSLPASDTHHSSSRQSSRKRRRNTFVSSSSPIQLTQFLIYRYLIHQKTNQFVQKIVVESESVIQEIFHANCSMSFPLSSMESTSTTSRHASKKKVHSRNNDKTNKYRLHFTYYNAEDRQYHTDMILDGTRKMELCHSKEYHQLECIDATKGIYLLFSCAGRSTGCTRVKLFQLALRASGEQEKVLLKDFGKVLWYNYEGGAQKKLVFLVRQQGQQLLKNGRGSSSQLPSDPDGGSSRTHHHHNGNSTVKFEAYSLCPAPQTIVLLYRYSLVLSHVPRKTRNGKKQQLESSNEINPALIQPLLFPPSNLHLNNSHSFFWTKYHVLTLDNGSEVLCRCYQHPNDAAFGHYVRVSLFVFQRDKKQKYSFKLRLNENKVDPSSTSDDFTSIKNHITFISQGNLVVVFVSGQYLKLIDCSEHNPSLLPQSLLTIQLSTDAKDFLPTVPHIDEAHTGCGTSEFPFVVQIPVQSVTSSTKEQRASGGKGNGDKLFASSKCDSQNHSTMVLNLSNGRLYNMQFSRGEVVRFLIQQKRAFVPLMHLSILHLNDYKLAGQILRNMSLDSDLLYLDSSEAIQEYIVSVAYIRAKEQGLPSQFLSLLPRSLIFEHANGSEIEACNLLVEVAREKQNHPFGLREWQPLWLDSSASPANNGGSSPKMTLTLLDFVTQNHSISKTPRSSTSNKRFTKFFKSLLQLQNRDDLLKRVEDPFAMSQRWLFFVCLNSVISEQLSNVCDLSAQAQKRLAPVITQSCKDFTRILSQTIEEVYQILKTTQQPSNVSVAQISQKHTHSMKLGYFKSLEVFYSALQEFGLPLPQMFSEEFVLEAYKCLPRHKFLQYCDRNVFFINHAVIKKIAAQEHRQADLVVHLTRLLYYKNLHSPENREQQHEEIQNEIRLFQKARQDGESHSVKSDTHSSSSVSSQDQIWHNHPHLGTDSTPVDKPMLNALLTGAVLSYYHSYIQLSPSGSEYSTTTRSMVGTPRIFSPQSDSSLCSPRSDALSPLIIERGDDYHDPCTTPLNSFVASVQVDGGNKPKQKHSYDDCSHDDETTGLICVKQKSKRLGLALTPNPKSTFAQFDEKLAQEKHFLARHAKEFSKNLFSPETLSPIGPNPDPEDTFNSSMSLEDSSDVFSASDSIILSPINTGACASSPLSQSSPLSRAKGGQDNTEERGIFRRLMIDASTLKDSRSSAMKAQEQEEEASEEARSIFTYTKSAESVEEQ